MMTEAGTPYPRVSAQPLPEHGGIREDLWKAPPVRPVGAGPGNRLMRLSARLPRPRAFGAGGAAPPQGAPRMVAAPHRPPLGRSRSGARDFKIFLARRT